MLSMINQDALVLEHNLPCYGTGVLRSSIALSSSYVSQLPASDTARSSAL
jgi:hypothetical protein